MLAKTILSIVAVGASFAAAYNPYLAARGFEEDGLSHIYSRDLYTRDAEIQEDLSAALRIRELAIRDPELLELHARDHGAKTAALIGGITGAIKGGEGNRLQGATVGAGVGYLGAHAVHAAKNAYQDYKANHY